MKRLKVLIVEDLPDPLKQLKDNLSNYDKRFDLDNIASATTYKQAEIFIANGHTFDVSFLDMYLDDGKTCLNLLEACQNKLDAFGILVFNTINKEELENLKRFKIPGKYFVLENKYYPSSLAKLVNELPYFSENDIPFLLSLRGKKTPVKQSHILYIEVNKFLSDVFHEVNGAVEKGVVQNTLSKILEELDSNSFQQTSRNTAVNINFIRRIEDETIVLNGLFNNKEISVPLSQNYRKALIDRYRTLSR